MDKRELKKLRQEARRDTDGAGDTDTAPRRPSLQPETKRSVVVVLACLAVILATFSLLGWAGGLGRGIDRGLEYLFGWGKYAIPAILLVVVYLLLQPSRYVLRLPNYIGLGLFVLGFSSFLHLAAVPADRAVADIAAGRGGGYVGLILYYVLVKTMGPWAAGIVLAGVLIVSLLVLFDVSLRRLYEQGNIFTRIATRFREFFYRLRHNMDSTDDVGALPPEVTPPEPVADVKFEAKPLDGAPVSPQSVAVPRQQPLFRQPQRTVAKIDVPLDLLESSNAKPTSGDIEAIKQKIFLTLKNFGIDVEMGETKVGPTVTQYTLKPAEGVKLAQITTLSNDLALALAAHPIRIEAPIPGKSLVGIEVPNRVVAVVKLKELM
ncbi:MAG: DNA translocase FtsK 4TM domain-containing protein, partial [Patescibacteria group bacterium]